MLIEIKLGSNEIEEGDKSEDGVFVIPIGCLKNYSQDNERGY